MVLFALRSHRILKSKGMLQITSLISKTWVKYLWQGMGLNEWNIPLESKYIIRLEDGKEHISFTCKSLNSGLPHHQSIIAKFYFSRFLPLA
jgi:hypothetical protein